MKDNKDKTSKKILVVDDDDMMREIYVEVFKRNGFEVSSAKDGLEGLDKATASTPDIIFTGIVMPKMDGFTMIESLKKNTLTSQVPIVISSHLGREEDRKRSQELGAKDFFIKDFDSPNEVVARVRAIFETSFYNLKINPKDLDAPRMAKDLFGSESFQCTHCQEEKIMRIEVKNIKSEEFCGKFLCPQCDSSQLN